MTLSSLDLTGRRALVTGGGSGLGRQMTLALAEAGAEVVLCGRNPESLDRTAGEARELGADATPIVCDITDPDQLTSQFSDVGRIDILVNNAGRGHRHKWETVSMTDWHEVFELNVDSVLRLCQLFAPPMAERRWGRVINVASVYGSQAGDPAIYPFSDWDYASYFASKHGVIGLTRYLAVRLAPYGVCVNSLSPGMFPTLRGDGDPPEVSGWDQMIARTPMKRLGNDEDLKAAVVFLASEGAGFVTGQDLRVDGGWSIW
jgi:NAD(P)-dependent dehydrogenase (short-subunit alcohol dehydrogenase family)